MRDYYNKLEDFWQKTAFSFFVIAVIFILDSLTPRGFATWILYMVPISIVPYKTIDKTRIYLISSIITVLIWSGFYIKSPGTIAPQAALINRGFFTVVLCIITYVQVQRSKAHKNLLKSEEELRRSEERFRIAQEVSPDGFVTFIPKLDAQGELTDFIFTFENEAAAKMNGTRPNEVIGHGLLELFPGHKHTQFFQAYKEVYETKRTVEFIDHYKGETFKDDIWFRVLAVPTSEGIAINAQDITEQKKSEKALMQGRVKLIEAQRIAHIGSYTLYYDNNTVEYSEELFRIFGWDPLTKNVTYDDIMKSIHPDDYEFVSRTIKNSIEQKSSIEFDYRIVTPDGEVKYLHTRRDPVFNDEGKLIGAFGTSMDITQRKLQELKLEEVLNKIQGSESRLLEAQRLAHVGSWELDLITGKREWTEETFNIFEFDLEQGAPPMDKVIKSFHPEDRPWVTEKIMEGLNKNIPVSFEARLLLPENKIKYVKYIARPVYNESGRLIKRVGAVADITELKFQQVKLEETLEQLQRSEAQLLEAQKLARLGNYSIDFKNGGKMQWSDEMYNIWELDKSKPLPPVDEVWKRVHPDDLEELNRMLYNQLPGGEKVETDFRILFPEGRVKFVHLITRVIFDENGTLLRREGIEMDITERKMAQLELERTLEKLERSNKELEQFAYIASHDLQEPLRMVASYMGLLEKKYGPELDEKAKEFIEYAVDGARRMSGLINDLLTYSRITTRAREFTEVDLNKTFSDVTHDLQILIQEKDARIYSSKLPVIKADPVQMHQLLQNIIGNAIKFHGERTPVVNISAERKKIGWLFSIRDNGIGIDPESFERIFQVFQRLHEMGKYPGTGIGLAICQKIVERHGGRIWVESKAGEGTTFHFTIPEHFN